MGIFTATNDFFERLRSVIIPPLGAFVQSLNESYGFDLYVNGATRKRQFVGHVDMPEEEFETVLTDMGFQRNPLASLKHLAHKTNEHEEGSFRLVHEDFDQIHPDYQLHVVLYDGSVLPDAETGVTYVYAHYEYRWDKYPIKHYRGVGMRVDAGVRMMRKLLTEEHIEYSPE